MASPTKEKQDLIQNQVNYRSQKQLKLYIQAMSKIQELQKFS